MGLSRFLTTISDFAIMMLSVAVMATGVWLSTRSGGGACVSFIQIPLIIIGVVMFVVSFAGFIGSLNGVRWLLFLYLVVMFVAMWALIGFTIFSILVTNTKAGKHVAGQGFKSYRIPDFSNFLQKQVNDTKKWSKIESCIREAKVCTGSSNKFFNLTDIYAKKLGSVQAGCCIPPKECGFTYNNGTWDETIAAPLAISNTDCQTFSSNKTSLCYNCETCKAGLLKTVTDDWRGIAYLNLALVGLLFILYSVGCCALRSVNREVGKGVI